MKQVIIHSESELVDALRNVLDSNLFRVIGVDNTTPHRPSSITVKVDYEGHTATYAAECRLHPAAAALNQIKAATGVKKPALLVTVRLTESVVNQCRALGISCIDLNGSIWLKAPGLLIDRTTPASPIRYRLAEAEIRFFSPKSTRLARALLSAPDRTWRQRDLAELTALSQGLLSRLLNHAAGQGWVQGRRGDWRLVSLDPLLDEWVKADNWTKRVTLRQYSSLSSDFPAIARQLAAKTVGDIAFTQWFAANLRFPYTQAPVVSAYRHQFLNADEQEALRVREVADGGRLWILVPRDAGVFQSVRNVDGIPVVCDSQIYLDLLQVGLRGPDQAKALREWKGFCRI